MVIGEVLDMAIVYKKERSHRFEKYRDQFNFLGNRRATEKRRDIAKLNTLADLQKSNADFLKLNPSIQRLNPGQRLNPDFQKLHQKSYHPFNQSKDQFNQSVAQHYEDLLAAINCLHDFGFDTSSHKPLLNQAKTTANGLKLKLDAFINAEQEYRESLAGLMKLLENSGMKECVDDLISVRNNTRNFSKKSRSDVI